MKTAVPNLHLNLSNIGPHSYGGCGQEAVTSPVPITPMDQMVQQPPHLQRLGSVSSQSSAMSTDDEGDRDGVDMDHDWTQHEDELLMQVFQEVSDHPTVAPFAGRIPPSGIVNKVAKQSVKRAPAHGLYMHHTVPNIRRRLLVLCDEQPSQRQQQQAPESPMQQQNGYSSTLMDMNTPASSRPTTPVENVQIDQARNREIQSWLMQQQAPSPPPQANFEFPPRALGGNGASGGANRPLASPFQEHLAMQAPTQLPQQANTQPAQDPFPNFTAHRKKESLQMKRRNFK